MSNVATKTKVADEVKVPTTKVSAKDTVTPKVIVTGATDLVKVPANKLDHAPLTIEELTPVVQNVILEVAKDAGSPPSPEATVLLIAGEEPAPTDRQIKNAERVLRAAGRDSETVAAEIVARTLENKQETGILSIDGVVQTPLLTGVTVTRNRLNTENSDYGLYIPYVMGETAKDKVFSVYRIEIDKAEVIYALDNESTVELSSDASMRRPFSRHRAMGVGSLILINSVSKHDTIMGESSLLNAATSNCLLNSSVLCRIDDPKPAANNLPWGGCDSLNEFSENRMVVKNSQFKRATIENSDITPGTYIDTYVRDSRVESTGHVTLLRTDIYKSRVDAPRVLLRDVNAISCTFSSETELTIEASRFSNIYTTSGSIHIPNKFCFLELDTPWGKLNFIRATRNEFSLGAGHYRQERFKLDVTREEILEFVKSQAGFGSWSGDKTPSTLISDSIAEYLADSVMSRLTVINLLDSARQLVNDISGNRALYEDPYSAA